MLMTGIYFETNHSLPNSTEEPYDWIAIIIKGLCRMRGNQIIQAGLSGGVVLTARHVRHFPHPHARTFRVFHQAAAAAPCAGLVLDLCQVLEQLNVEIPAPDDAPQMAVSKDQGSNKDPKIVGLSS